jgi:SAM-dependent methyltransferase
VSGFSAEWLALREPADVAARAEDVTRAVVDALAARAPVRVVDLGSGTGSNVRYLASRLSGDGEWLLVDNDPGLLAAAARSVPVRVDTRVHDLRRFDAWLLDGRDLVTASALLDLVSDDWLLTLAGRCRAAEAHVLFALNYDGRLHCTPADVDDELVRDAVNRHQHGDKGFGPALGPLSGLRAEGVFRAAGYRITRSRSDWKLGPPQAELQRQLIRGWARAAAEIAPADAARIDAWAVRRIAHVDAGVSWLVVGHDDVGGVFVGGE